MEKQDDAVLTTKTKVTTKKLSFLNNKNYIFKDSKEENDYNIKYIYSVCVFCWVV